MKAKEQHCTKKHVVIVIIDCCDRTIASNAIHRAKVLSKYFDITLISNAFPDSIENNITLLTVELGNFHWLRRFGQIMRELVFSYQVRKCLNVLNRKADFIVCHGHSSAYFVGRFFQKKKIPYALFMHGDIFDRPWGMYGVLLTSFYRAITPAVARNADLIICQSPDQATLAKRHHPLPGKTVVIPNGIDANAIGLQSGQSTRRTKDLNKGDVLKILFVGNFSPEKGLDILIEACVKLFTQGIPFLLTIIGPDKEEPALKKMISDTGCIDNFNLVGKVNRKRLAHYYCNTHLFCLPSRSEPLANVILESLICGTPVVASDVGGNAFMVKTHYNGWLFEKESAAGLATILQRIALHPEELSTVSSNCVASVKTKFSWESVGNQISHEVGRVIQKACLKKKMVKPGTERQTGLDLLRVCSIFYIVGFWHLFEYTPDVADHKNFFTVRLTYIFLGTLVFISGFFIGKTDFNAEKETLFSFYRKRVFRIYPLYVLAIFIFTLANLSNVTTSLKAVLLLSMFLKPAPLTLWFVSMIFWYYLLSPLILLCSRGKNALKNTIVFIFSFIGTALVCQYFLGSIDYRMLIYFPVFSFGMYCSNNNFRVNIYSLVAVFFGSVLFSGVSFEHQWIKMVFESLMILSGSYICFSLFQRIQINSYRLRVIVYFLSYSSYCMYLFHRPLYLFFMKIFFPQSQNFQILYLIAFCFPCIVLISFGIQRYYDFHLNSSIINE